MSDTVTEMDESGQEPVDEHRLVLSTGAYGPLPRSRGQRGPVTLMPQRAQPSDKFSDHSVGKPVIRRLLMITARDTFPATRP
ncbi:MULTISPECIES: hypothetical protein [unclassified Streptomyces]|uniref:hypothetical protein n=1 Tax=unclassified Streptomyces TaxID=2593676 RepID=UPI0033AA481A